MDAKREGERHITAKELSQLYWLNREVERDKAQLEALRGRAEGVGTQIITGMPHIPGITDKVGNRAVEMADLQSNIEANIRRCLSEVNRLNRYINDIPDALTRLIFAYRFVNGLPWGQVAASVGGGNTARGVQQRVFRYLYKR
ncbi:MAG: hypothetical protein LBJ84_03355 [Oscillospiraceae bacterium]|jgi:hypothetical protein|nr:hypothetical protein [Oscillospiraceae bacterium]